MFSYNIKYNTRVTLFFYWLIDDFLAFDHVLNVCKFPLMNNKQTTNNHNY